MTFLFSLFLFIVVLAPLILVHEWGHFIVAKKSGIRVDEFAIGFPPKLFGKKYGETEYTINALPLGGFVRIFGEDAEEEAVSGSDARRSFVHQPKYIQALVLLGGVIMNVIFAWLLFSVIFMVGVPTAIGEGEPVPADAELTITSILSESPAEEAGLLPGDTIAGISAGNEELAELSPDTVANFVANHSGEVVALHYIRGEESGKTELIPMVGLIEGESERPAIGIGMDVIGTVRYGVFQAPWQAAIFTGLTIKNISVALLGFLGSIVLFQADFSQVAGPVGIADLVGDVSALGLIPVLILVANISIALAVFNVLPFPALDGGRLLFLLIEAVKGSPIKPVVARALNMVGFSLLILLVLVVTYSDIARIFN